MRVCLPSQNESLPMHNPIPVSSFFVSSFFAAITRLFTTLRAVLKAGNRAHGVGQIAESFFAPPLHAPITAAFTTMRRSLSVRPYASGHSSNQLLMSAAA